jgi:hypothetical protein
MRDQVLKQADSMVLVFSENANTSAHVRREVANACDHETTVIPLRIRDVTPKQGLKYYLDELHASIPGVPLHLAGRRIEFLQKH